MRYYIVIAALAALTWCVACEQDGTVDSSGSIQTQQPGTDQPGTNPPKKDDPDGDETQAPATLKAGQYKGSTDKGGSISFTIASGAISGDFSIKASTDCGTLSFGLGHVRIKDGVIYSEMTEKTVIEVTGGVVSDTKAEGEYIVDGNIALEGHCKGQGTWTATWQDEGSSKPPSTKPPSTSSVKCNCQCKCSYCGFKMEMSCKGTGCPKSCSAACSQECPKTPGCGSYKYGSGSCY